MLINNSSSINSLSLSPRIKVGVLLLHGLTGTPDEMGSIASVLENMGCRVEIPMLPGHGATTEDLVKTGWKDWVAGGRKALYRLSQSCDQVYVGGLSMGALISVLLAEENQKISGIVAMSTPIHYDGKNASNPLQLLLPIIDLFPFIGRTVYWIDKHGGNAGFGKIKTYSGSLREVQKLVRQVKKQAPGVNCPVLIMHGTKDTISTVENAKILYSWLGSHKKQILYLEDSNHVLTRDVKKEEVANNFAVFVCRTAVAT